MKRTTSLVYNVVCLVPEDFLQTIDIGMRKITELVPRKMKPFIIDYVPC